MSPKKTGFEAPVGFSIGGLQIKPRAEAKPRAKAVVSAAGKARGKAKAAKRESDTFIASGGASGVTSLVGTGTSGASKSTHPKGGGALKVPGGTKAHSSLKVPAVEVNSVGGLDDAAQLFDVVEGKPVVPVEQRREVRQLSARNGQVGSKDAVLQTKLVHEAWEQQYGARPKPTAGDPALPGRAVLNNRFKAGINIEDELVSQLRAVPGVELEVPDNPVHVFVTPHEGNSARTRMTGNYVVKGYDDHKQAEIEWLGNRFMQLTGEITPDMHRASLPLRERIMAADREFKMVDGFETISNPRRLEFGQPFCFTKTIEVKDPKHCLVMPKIFGSNIGNIVEDPVMRASFAKRIKSHTQEMARMAFKDIVLGNSDRVIRIYPGASSPPHLPPLEEVAAGSPMNLGNIMFQTIEGEVKVGTGFAIDNFGNTVNKLGEEEGRSKELGAFEFYMEDVAASIKGGADVSAAPHHLVNQIVASLRGGVDSDELVLGAGATPLYTMSDDDFRATVIAGLKRGWGEVVKNKAAVREFLESTAEEDLMETTSGQEVRSIYLKKVEIAERVFEARGI